MRDVEFGELLHSVFAFTVEKILILSFLSWGEVQREDGWVPSDSLSCEIVHSITEEQVLVQGSYSPQFGHKPQIHQTQKEMIVQLRRLNQARLLSHWERACECVTEYLLSGVKCCFVVACTLRSLLGEATVLKPQSVRGSRPDGITGSVWKEIWMERMSQFSFEL